jgi:FkbM family methyltransferase
MENLMKAFIDAGGFDGDTVRLFLKHYPNAEEYKIYSFEPNVELHGNYPPGVILSNRAVWIKDGHADFYLSQKEMPLGSTLLKEKNTGKLDYAHPVRVPTMDFSKWIRRKFNKNTYIVLKLDIEGAEYPVLNKMIEDGTIKWINEIYVDFHAKKVGVSKEEHNSLVNKLYEVAHLRSKEMCGEKGKIEV